MSEPVLRIDRLTKRFGGLAAVNDLSLTLESGRLNAIIGPNGAGKTTLFNLISGFLAPDTGRIVFRGTDITGMKTHTVSRLGIKRTLQVKSVFPQMTVAENLWITAHATSGQLSPLRSARHYPRTQAKVDEAIERLGLAAVAPQLAGTLSYGDVALLEIGMALVAEPKLLLLDEPICGMSPAETERTVGIIRDLAQRIDVVIIEHDIEVVFAIADHVTVMAQGALLAAGTPAAMAANAQVREAYLGQPEDVAEADRAAV